MKTLTKYKLNNLLTVIFFSLLVLSQSISADVTASVDREYAYEGETITLSVTASNISISGQPDFSPLAKDFELFGTSQSSSISIINGKRSDSQTWSIRLRPKKLGQIDVPSIQVGQHSTLPLTVDVKPIPVQTGVQQNQSIFITLEIDSEAKQFFVQQHIPVVARLYYLNEVTQGMITDPQPENATVERLGEDRKFTAPYNGKSYKVFERRYSLLAEKSGDLTIPAISFRGYLSKQQPQQNKGQRYDPFSQFFDRSPFSTSSSPVSVLSEPITLFIESQPDNFDGAQWLPAESVELSDSWTSQPPNFKVGEPVSRTISLTAKGLLASQVQPLELPDQPAFRRYAEPAETETRTDGQTVYAISHRTFTYIPTAEGNQEIPAIEVKWWDVINSRQASAMLPAWNIQVAADPNQDAKPSAKLSKKQAAEMPIKADQNSAADTQSNSENATQQANEESENIPDLSGALETLKQHPYWLAGFILLIIILWLLRRGKNGGNIQASTNPLPASSKSNAANTAAIKVDMVAEKAAIDAFNRVCQIKDDNGHNDIRAVAQALLKMAEATWPESPPRSLGALAEKVSSGKQALLDLDRVLYAGSDKLWNADEIRQYFKNGFSRPAPSTKQEKVLKPLYPD